METTRIRRTAARGTSLGFRIDEVSSGIPVFAAGIHDAVESREAKVPRSGVPMRLSLVTSPCELMDVIITFRTSSYDARHGHTGLHERTLSAVPPDEAKRMVEDFTRYRTAAPQAAKRMRYDFKRDGKDVIVALDFEHVVALTTAES